MSWISVAPRRWGRTARKPGVAFPGDVLDFGRTTTMMQDSAQNRAPVSPRRPAFRSAASPRKDDAGEGQAHRVRSPLVAPSPAAVGRAHRAPTNHPRKRHPRPATYGRGEPTAQTGERGPPRAEASADRTRRTRARCRRLWAWRTPPRRARRGLPRCRWGLTGCRRPSASAWRTPRRRARRAALRYRWGPLGVAPRGDRSWTAYWQTRRLARFRATLRAAWRGRLAPRRKRPHSVLQSSICVKDPM